MYRKRKKFKPPYHGRGGRSPGKGPSAGAGKFRPRPSSQLKPLLQRIGVPEAAPFIPDPFQEEAIAALERSDVLVSAPTGAGKTWIAVQVIQRLLANGRRTWYASPLKALSNAKYTEFSELFGDENVGILTGDRKEKTSAPVIVGTTEILRNQLYDAMYTGENLPVDLVVLDEAHYLGDEDRGVVWEEVMIYLPARVRLLLLSATVSNAGQIAGWLEWLRGGSCQVVETRERPVPLIPLFMFPDGEVTPFVRHRAITGKVRQFLERHPRQGLTPRQGVANFSEIIAALHCLNLLPAIFFLKSRADCNQALQAAQPRRVQEKDEERRRFSRRLGRLVERHPYLKRHRQVVPLRQARVAAHHGGQLPTWKALVETLMKEGELDAIFSTSTVAAGVNFPARTVVLSQSDRFNGREFVPLSATDLLQMTGRAGRRGMDKVGFVLILPGPFQDPNHLFHLLRASPEPIDSRIQITFTMVLNLLLSHSPEEIKELLARSFATYQDLDTHRDLVEQSKELEQQLSSELEGAGCGDVNTVLQTLSRKREIQAQLEEARGRWRRERQLLFKRAYLGPGRLFRSKKGELFVALRQESRKGVEGVTAVRVRPGPRVRRGRLRSRWLRLDRLGPLLDCCLDLPDQESPEQWAESVAATSLADCPPLETSRPLPPSSQASWEELRRRVAKLEAALEALPCNRCPQWHRCEPKRKSKFKEKINRVLDLRQRLDEVANRLWYEFNRYFRFLQQEGYVDDAGRLTPDGSWTSQLRLDQPLMIAEGIRRRVFPDHDPALLAGLIAPFVTERDQPGTRLKLLSARYPELTRAFNELAVALRPLQARLRQQGFSASSFSLWSAAAIYAWATGAGWEETLGLSGLDEGDLAMLIYRTADNLRQLEALSQSHPHLAETATTAIEGILREPVVVPT